MIEQQKKEKMADDYAKHKKEGEQKIR